MSDSDSELLANNVFTFQNESTIVSARGPAINTSNLTGLSFRNNVHTSTMNVPKNFEWQRRVASNYDQRSISSRRETSPMSIASACDVRQRNFKSTYYTNRMSSQRSVYNGRGGSPVSMRSIDSNATVSAVDIAMALKNTQFNKYESRIIQEACNKFMKHKTRRRIEKRRNLRLFLKGYRRKSGNDSGELGSDSSISSDDNRSTRTFNHRKNMSSCRSTKTDVTDFRKTIKESNMFNDCTNRFQQNRMPSVVGGPANLNTSRSSVSSFRSMIGKPHVPKSMPPSLNFNKTQSQSSVTQNSMTQRDRFKNGFLLPSQRFNRSVAATSIPETGEKVHTELNRQQHASNREHDIPAKSPHKVNSDDDEMFSEIITIERPAKNHRKRSIESDDDMCLPNHKRPKIASPCKNESESLNNSLAIESAKKDFEFAKPVFPIRKSANLKAKEKIISTFVNMNPTEKLISKSSLPPMQSKQILQTKVIQDKDQTEEDITEISQNTTNLSMRPSFTKRKLFTQKMDVTEKTNDILAANSPQNSVYGAIQKEQNKARKLVTSKYCLSRDIHTDENNLLDLIHKIVPADLMNATNQTSKTVAQSNISEDNDNWDVTSIISTRNNDDDMSDTFTDEDIVNADSKKIPSPKVAAKKIEKTPPKVTQATKKVLVEKNGLPNKTVQKYVKSFWDTDFESDAEGTPATRKAEFKENNKTEKTGPTAAPKIKFQGFSSMFPANKTTLANNSSIMNSTVDSIQRFNNTNRSFKLCSHRNNKPNPKTATEKVANSHIEPLNMKQKTAKASRCIDLSKQENFTDCNKKTIQQENPNEIKLKPENKTSPSKNLRTNKEKNGTPKKAKKKENKKTSSKQNKTLISDEKIGHQNNKTEIAQSKAQNNKKIGPEQNKTQNKKEAKGNQNKTINNKKYDANKPNKSDTLKSQTQSNKKSSKNSNNEKTNVKKAYSTQLDTMVNNNQKLTSKKPNVSKLSDSIVYEYSLNKTNNNSIRPVRSCRISKQNESLDTSRANRTLTRSLRSRETSLNKDPEKNKTAAKNTKKTKTRNESTLSNLSFSIANDKKLSSITRPFQAKEIDTSDVSFSLTNDKDSPLPKRTQGNSARCGNNLKQAVVFITPLRKNSLRIKDMYLSKNAPRPFRNKLANRRYVS